MLPIETPEADPHTTTFAPGHGDVIGLGAGDDPSAAFFIGRADSSMGLDNIGAKLVTVRTARTGVLTIVVTDEVLVLLIESMQKLLRSPGAGS